MNVVVKEEDDIGTKCGNNELIYDRILDSQKYVIPKGMSCET